MMNARLYKDFEELFNGDRSWIEKLNASRVLVTGATGLIGSIIGKAILFYNNKYHGDIKLICYVRNIDKAKSVYCEFLDSKYLDFCVGNIDDGIEYKGDIDYIIHCANTTSSKEYVNKPVETIHTIVVGTGHMLRFALRKKVKSFVYLSSMEVYGAPDPKKSKIKEADSGYLNTMSVRSSYSEGKRLAECLCASFASEYGLKAIVVRSAQVFGAGVSPTDKRIFIQLANSVIRRTDFVMHSDGSSFGNYCYTTDAAKAIMMLLTLGEAGQAYNVVNEDNTMTIKHMAEMVAHEVANDAFKIVYDIPESELTYGYGQKVVMRLSSEKMNKLGWKAKVPLKEMYLRMIQSLQSFGSGAICGKSKK